MLNIAYFKTCMFKDLICKGEAKIFKNNTEVPKCSTLHKENNYNSVFFRKCIYEAVYAEGL